VNPMSPQLQDRQPLPAALAAMLTLVCGLLGAACQSTPEVPDRPTWADVEPILRGNCTGCHGATAAITGSGPGMSPYRLDFYDMTAATCGEAAAALAGQTLAHGWATLIAADLTSPGSGWRPRMPPAPGPQLLDWERETVVRWATQTDPPRGEPHRDNRRPDIQLEAASGAADQRLAFTAVISDADGEAVVGSLEVGDLRLFTDHAGAFGADIDTSSWTAGLYPIRAVLCDGWDDVTYDLGTVLISHAISAPR
jgi:hypothetical protein